MSTFDVKKSKWLEIACQCHVCMCSIYLLFFIQKFRFKINIIYFVACGSICPLKEFLHLHKCVEQTIMKYIINRCTSCRTYAATTGGCHYMNSASLPSRYYPPSTVLLMLHTIDKLIEDIQEHDVG